MTPIEQRKSRDILAEQVGESAKQISRYIRLTQLIPAILDLVDSSVLPFTVGVAISYLSNAQQELLLAVMNNHQVTKISLSQAEELKAFANELNESLIVRILGLTHKQPPQRMLTIKIPAGNLGKMPRGLAADEEFQRRLTELVNEFIALNKDPKKKS